MEIRYHGHSCIQVTGEGGSFIIDPFLSGNPLAVTKAEEINVSYVLLTHGHSDHIQDAAAIAKRNDATVVSIVELATYMGWQGVKTIGFNHGGSVSLEVGRVKLVQAFHSSSMVQDEQKQIIYLGMPGGFIIETGGKTIYHAGDTGLFGDMKMIGERHQIDIAFLPIGDHFTMGPDDALIAAEWLKAKQVVPIHYNTFPPIRQDGEAFIAKLAEIKINGILMKPGETISL